MYDIQNARQRDGDATGNRRDRVDEILNRPQLGYGECDPLVGDDYGEYPEQPDDLTTPESRQFVTELFEHDKVNNLREAIEETTPATGDRYIVAEWRDAFERATELFDIDTSDDTESDEQRADSRLTELTEDYPNDMVTPSNPLVVSYLYAECGLSTEEIADVFSDHKRSVSPKQIRAILRNAGLIEATESEDSEPSHKLGGTSMNLRKSGNTGVNINTEAVARDPKISVERNE
jgi:hypothetical protein